MIQSSDQLSIWTALLAILCLAGSAVGIYFFVALVRSERNSPYRFTEKPRDAGKAEITKENWPEFIPLALLLVGASGLFTHMAYMAIHRGRIALGTKTGIAMFDGNNAILAGFGMVAFGYWFWWILLAAVPKPRRVVARSLVGANFLVVALMLYWTRPAI